MRRVLRGLAVSALVAAVLGFGAIRWLAHRTGVEGWSERTTPIPTRTVTDEALRAAFAPREGGVPAKAYEDAFVYLLEGFVNYRSPMGARANYPGTPSKNGRASDGVEGFARFFPLAASWLASGRPDEVEVGGRRVSISSLLREGLLAGTDRDGPEFWGVITTGNQRLFESADVALGVWLTRESIWAKLDRAQKDRVATWLRRALAVHAYEGNWSLIPILVERVLVSLGEDVCCDQIVTARYWREFKALSLGGGWIADGTQGADYYNAWAMQYVMYWIDRIDPAFDPEFIRSTNRRMVEFYQYMIGPKGAPLMGRSICYRMATPVPLLVAQALSPSAVSKGRAMRALDAAWSYFVTHGATRDGGITQGFCGVDLALVNDYTAPASCLWSARGLAIALALDREHGLLAAAREPLPVEAGDFRVAEPHLKWRLEGKKATGEIVLTIESNPESDPPPALLVSEEIEQLSEWEHARWNLERLRAGWTDGQDKALRQTQWIKPFSALPDSIREYDRTTARTWTSLLHDAGIDAPPKFDDLRVPLVIALAGPDTVSEETTMKLAADWIEKHRKKSPNTPIVLLTALATPSERGVVACLLASEKRIPPENLQVITPSPWPLGENMALDREYFGANPADWWVLQMQVSGKDPIAIAVPDHTTATPARAMVSISAGRPPVTPLLWLGC